MNWIRQHCHIVDHPKFTAAGAIGRDLWNWSMLFSGKHETDGAIEMTDLLATHWGAGGKKNIPVAEKLVRIGLWERTDSGFKICRWAEMGNQTKAEIEESRRVGREGRAERREASRKKSAPPPAPVLVSATLSTTDMSECPARTTPVVPTSTSYSSDLTGRKTSEVSRGPASDVQLVADPQAPPPDWFAGVIATVDTSTGIQLAAGEAWLRYAGHRGGKAQREGRPYPPTAPDAIHWLTTVMVKEARDERAKARHQADRDAKFDGERAKTRDAAGAPQPYHRIVKPEPLEKPPSTESQVEAMKKLTATLFGVGKTGT